MLFSSKLQNEIHKPWKDSYIDYELLKKLLIENVSNPGKQTKWTEKNESDFVYSLDLELEKVYSFQSSEYRAIDEKISSLENIIDTNIEVPANTDSNKSFLATFDYVKFQAQLEDALQLAQELDHFARLNFTAFVKIVNKHDRLHPEYSVKPLLNVRLNELPFHSEDYSPLLYRISVLYNFLRENFSVGPSSSFKDSVPLNSVNSSKAAVNLGVDTIEPTTKNFKFWIHPDNLMEVKTKLLRHLPVLIYKNDLDNQVGDENDSTVTSLYFDNSNFELYNAKLLKNNNSATLRLRWSGKLIEKPDIFLEKKLFNDDDDESETQTPEKEKLISFKIKEKYINSFAIDGDPSTTNKIIKKLSKKNNDEYKNQVKNIKNLQKFIVDNQLEPTLRCVYTRTAFQMPGDDKVRVIIDSDIMFIREDSFEKFRPIRDPSTWHRTDIDSKLENPYSLLRKGEFVKFPYSVMEITVKDNSLTIGNKPGSMIRKSAKWIEELTSSHLVKEVPNFSKFIQGVASLHAEDDRLDTLPFWLPELEKDIRKNPKEAYDEELQNLQNRKRSISLMSKVKTFSPRLKPVGDKVVEEDLDDYDSSDDDEDLLSIANYEDELEDSSNNSIHIVANEFSFHDIPRRSYTDVSFDDTVIAEEDEVELPPGVIEPKSYIKNAGPIKVEAKVWLANERTYLRWLHTCAILFFFTISIESSTHKSNFPEVSKWISLVYCIITLSILGWGHYIYKKRLSIIRQRSGEHLDNIIGPLVVSGSLIFILGFNFFVGLRKVMNRNDLMGKVMEKEGFTKDYFEFFVNFLNGTSTD